MQGDIFWAFLIFGAMSTMVAGRIFDKRANYLKITAMEGEIFFRIFNLWNNIYNGVEADF